MIEQGVKRESNEPLEIIHIKLRGGEEKTVRNYDSETGEYKKLNVKEEVRLFKEEVQARKKVDTQKDKTVK